MPWCRCWGTLSCSVSEIPLFFSPFSQLSICSDWTGVWSLPTGILSAPASAQASPAPAMWQQCPPEAEVRTIHALTWQRVRTWVRGGSRRLSGHGGFKHSSGPVYVYTDIFWKHRFVLFSSVDVLTTFWLPAYVYWVTEIFPQKKKMEKLRLCRRDCTWSVQFCMWIHHSGGTNHTAKRFWKTWILLMVYLRRTLNSSHQSNPRIWILVFCHFVLELAATKSPPSLPLNTQILNLFLRRLPTVYDVLWLDSRCAHMSIFKSFLRFYVYFWKHCLSGWDLFIYLIFFKLIDRVWKDLFSLSTLRSFIFHFEDVIQIRSVYAEIHFESLKYS